MFLSVIIPTRDRALYLKRVLESLEAQSYYRFEVLVVDNGSTDDTPAVVEGFRDRLPDLRYFREEKPGLHEGRHRGMREAGSGILVYADDDIEASDTWLAGIAKAFDDDGVALAGGKCLPKFEAEPPRWLLKRWEKGVGPYKYVGYLSIMDLGEDVIVNPPMVYGCNFAVRKDVLQRVGGFHPDSMPPDMLKFRGDGESWVERAVKESGLKSLYHPEATVYHHIPAGRMTLDYFCKRAYAQGVSDSYAGLRYESTAGGAGGDWLKSFLNFSKRAVKNALRIDTDTLLLDRTIKQGYRAGFAFHRAEVKKDPKLMDWVMKENYF